MDFEQLVQLHKAAPEFKAVTLTETVREIDAPANFLVNLLYGRRETLETEDVEIGLKTAGRIVAPFVRVGGEAILIPGISDSFNRVQAPNIRMKTPFTAANLLYQRRAGDRLYVTGGSSDRLDSLGRKIADDLDQLVFRLENAIEWLAAQGLTGTIAYQVSPNENFTITIPRPGTHDILAPIFWDDADPQLPDPDEDTHTVKRIMSEDPGLAPTHALCGSEAGAALRRLAKRQDILFDKRRLDDGSITLQRQFEASGAIYLGRAFGVDWWEYPRQLTLDDGTVVDLIRPKYVEFVHVGPAADRRIYFASIPDMSAVQQGLHVGERFSKSWVQEDPSQIMQLLHSRPLPWPRRANTWVSMKVVSG